MGLTSGLAKCFLCLTFFLSGFCKLSPKWGSDVYASMDAAFRERFTPFWQQAFLLSEMGVTLDPTVVKTAFGSLEVLCAVLLFSSYKIFSSMMLFGLMSAVMLTHVFLGEWSYIPMPFVLCCTSLVVCYIDGPMALSEGGKPKAA